MVHIFWKTRHSFSRSLLALSTLTLVAAVASTGCVSKKRMETYVDTRVAPVEQRVEGVESQVEVNQTRLMEQQQVMNEQQEMLASVSDTARDAFERAQAAGKLAEGKLLYETVLSDDGVQFGFESSDLGGGASEALDRFAEDLKTRNENVFIEIQGHTDGSGSDRYNLELGQERAEAVRHYLNRSHSLPLHRMSVISYGEAAPVADNKTREGRGRNRRVVLVVLK